MGPATRTAIPSLLAMLALLGALQTLVLNPLAAAPADRSLTQIYADLAPQVSVFELAAFPALGSPGFKRFRPIGQDNKNSLRRLTNAFLPGIDKPSTAQAPAASGV